MGFCRQVLLSSFGMLAMALAILRADTGDVDSAHDYPGFPRVTGFVISDYDEDNPVEFDFPVARPLPIDASHVEMMHVKGHRYVIRYEPVAGARVPSLFQMQRYYEKLASDAGFTVEKSGAVGDVTETFYRTTEDHQIWVYLEPAISAYVLTVVESAKVASLPPAPPRLAATTAEHATLAPPAEVISPIVPKVATPAPAPPPVAPTVDPNDDSLYESLNQEGRVVLPFLFQPGKDELDPSSQPLIDRVALMMKRHPDIFLRIEGHTDNSGDPEDNMRLSAQRAISIQDKLIKANVDRKRLDSVGVGGLQPLADNNTAEGREKNRRIELVLWKRIPGFHNAAPNGQNYYPSTSTTR